tara:strand:+ start:4176 stop:5288 length:1113 start_codon:yes stop_codon:yes gene_type:complete
MTRVNNWQLRREMDYPYKESRPDRQFAAVFNINRCIGCQTCTMACKSTWTFNKGQEHMWWNNVETKPFGGYPQHWDVKLLEKLGPQKWEKGEGDSGKTYQGKTIFEAAPKGEVALGYLPEDKEWRFPNIYEDTSTPWKDKATLPSHDTFFFYLQRICNHCTYPACAAACPRKAIYKRKEDGIVLIDQERCRGYRKCVEQCPYKKPMYNPQTRISEKCIACYPRVEQDTVTRCIAACVGKIRLQGWINLPEKIEADNPMDYLVHVAKVALPSYPQFGTEPNVFYIPPRWVPRGYLKQLFGPGVENAIERYSDPDPDLLGLLQLFGTTQQIIEKFRVTEKDAIGYDAHKREIIRVPLEDPIVIRPPIYHNIT